MALTVDPLTSTSVCNNTVMVTGTATPGSDVYAIGGRATSDIRVSNPLTGAFCIDVPLRENQTNELEIQARHPELGLAPSRQITVTHESSTCSDAGEPAEPVDSELINVAVGAPVASKDDPKDNPPGNIVDDSLETWTSWKGGSMWNPWDPYKGWVMISLEKPTAVEQIEVHWRDIDGAGDDYGKEFWVLYAPADGFGDPAPNAWPQVSNGYVDDGKGGVDRFYPNGEYMRHIALYLMHNGHDSWTETFAIAEIRVLKRAQEYTAPPVLAQTCDSVGAGS